MSDGAELACCARHPEREAATTCTRCGDFLCEACIHPSASDLCASCVALGARPAIKPVLVWVAELLPLLGVPICGCFSGLVVLGATQDGVAGVGALGLAGLSVGLVLALMVPPVMSLARLPGSRVVLCALHGLSTPFTCCFVFSLSVQAMQGGFSNGRSEAVGAALSFLCGLVPLVAAPYLALHLGFNAQAAAWYAAKKPPHGKQS